MGPLLNPPYPIELHDAFGDPYTAWVRRVSPAFPGMPVPMVSVTYTRTERLDGSVSAPYTLLVCEQDRLPAELLELAGLTEVAA